MPFGVGSVRSYMGYSNQAYFDPQMLDLIRALHKTGYKIGLASNSRRRWVLPALKHAGIAKLFDMVITPDDEVAKPDQAFYRLLLERVGVMESDVLFVDDRTVNVRAAVEHGIQAIHFQTYDQFVAELSTRDIKIPATS